MKKEEVKEIPVYVFMGFLGSGKTQFAKDTLIKQNFTEGQKTLLLVCEDGEEEYDAEELKKKNIFLEFITDETLTTDYLLELSRKYQPENVMIEYNGMWELDKIFQIRVPKGWTVVQIISFVDATTFDVYVTNMKKVMMDQLRNADMVIYDFVKMNSAEIESLSADSALLNQGEPKLEQSNYLKGWDFFLHDFDNRGYVWRVLFNKRFIENSHLHFIPGITSQDIPFMVDSLLINGTVVKVPLISIIYRQRPDSIVYNPNKKRVMDLTVAMKDLWVKKKNNSYPIEIRRRLTDALYHIFNNFQWRIILNKDVYAERHDIIRDLRDAIPDLKFGNSIQQLFTTCLFRLMPYRFFEMRKLFNDIIWKYKKLRRFPKR